MKKRLLTSLTVFAFALGFSLWSGCKEKDDCPPCGDAYKTIPQEMKDWALFEDGSWWVYRLTEDTTVFDTVRVSPNSKRFFRSNGTCGDNNPHAISCSETITYKLQHSNIKYFPYHGNSETGGFDEINLYFPHGGGVCMSYNNAAASGTSGRLFCLDPLIEGEFYGNFTLIDSFSSNIFNGIVVRKGFHSNIIKNYTPEPGSYRNVYWGMKIGLLRIEITHYSNGETKNWELINYEVKQ